MVLPHLIWSTVLLPIQLQVRRQVYDRIWTGFCQKKAFFISTTQKAQFCLCQLWLNFWKWPAQGATPGQNFHGTNHLARLPRFQVPGVSGSKVISLRKKTKISQNFFLRFWAAKSWESCTQVNSQVSACGKPKFWREKCAVQRSNITFWRWLMLFFMWIATHFRSFLKFYVNNFWHSTQLSSLTIPTKHL